MKSLINGLKNVRHSVYVGAMAWIIGGIIASFVSKSVAYGPFIVACFLISINMLFLDAFIDGVEGKR